MIRRLLLAITFAAALPPGTAAAQEGVFAKVCRSSAFDMDTFLPITPENIEEQAGCDRIPLANLSLVRALLLLRPIGRGSFEYHFVRAKIALPGGETIYIDRFGGYRTPERDSALSTAGLHRLRGYLDEMADYSRSQESLRYTFAWAAQATHDLIVRTKGWPESDYGIGIGRIVGAGYWIGNYNVFDDQGPLVVKVWHKDDFEDYLSEEGSTSLGGDKSFELRFDPKTKRLIRQLREQ